MDEARQQRAREQEIPIPTSQSNLLRTNSTTNTTAHAMSGTAIAARTSGLYMETRNNHDGSPRHLQIFHCSQNPDTESALLTVVETLGDCLHAIHPGSP